MGEKNNFPTASALHPSLEGILHLNIWHTVYRFAFSHYLAQLPVLILQGTFHAFKSGFKCCFENMRIVGCKGRFAPRDYRQERCRELMTQNIRYEFTKSRVSLVFGIEMVDWGQNEPQRNPHHLDMHVI